MASRMSLRRPGFCYGGGQSDGPAGAGSRGEASGRFSLSTRPAGLSPWLPWGCRRRRGGARLEGRAGTQPGVWGGAGQWWRGTAAEGGVWARARSAATTAVNVAVSGAVGSRSTAPAMSGSAAGQAGSTGGSGRVGWSSTTAGNTTVGASWSTYHHRVGSIELVGAGDHVLAESA